MSTFEIHATVNRAYYEKRGRWVVEHAIESMSRALGHQPVVLASELRNEPKGKLIEMAMSYHRQMPE